MYFDTQAIILNSRPLGEYDYLVSALSGEWGLLEARLRGVRRHSGRLKPLKEPAMFVDLHCWGRPSQGIVQLLTGEILEPFVFIRDHFESLSTVLTLLDFGRQLTTTYDPMAEEKFLLTLETLASIGADPAGGFRWKLTYQLKMLDLSGWKFSASELTRELVDESLYELCRGIEGGRPWTDREAAQWARLDRLVEHYVEGIIGSPRPAFNTMAKSSLPPVRAAL